MTIDEFINVWIISQTHCFQSPETKARLMRADLEEMMYAAVVEGINKTMKHGPMILKDRP